MFTQFLELVLQPWVNLFNLSKIVFDSLNCCQAPQNHCEEKCEKFITRRTNNKSPSHFSFDTCRHSVKFWKARKSVLFFHLSEWKNSFIRGETSSFERNTIQSHLPETLKVFFWLIPFFFFFDTFNFAWQRPTCMFRRKQRFTWILASEMLASFSIQFNSIFYSHLFLSQ